MVGRGGRYGSMRINGMVLLCERHCVPLRPPWPPVPPTSRALPALCALPVCPPVLPLFFFFVLALLAAPARPACDLCSSSCFTGPAALCPISRLSPFPFSFSQSTLPARLPSLPVHRCHSCVPLVCPTPAPPSRPYPFPWVLPQSPPLTPSWLPGALCGRGGAQLVRCVPATVLQPRLPHDPHRLLRSMIVRVTRTVRPFPRSWMG